MRCDAMLRERERERERGGRGEGGERGTRGRGTRLSFSLSLFLYSYLVLVSLDQRSISGARESARRPLDSCQRAAAGARERGREGEKRKTKRSLPPHPPTHPPSFLPADDSARARARVRRDAFVIFSPDRSRGYARRSLLPERNSGNCCRLGELSAACRRRATRRAAKRNIE